MIVVVILALNLAAVEPADRQDIATSQAPLATEPTASADQKPVPTASVQPGTGETSAENSEPSVSAATPPDQAAATPDDFELQLNETTSDPLEGFNRVSFKVSMVVDKIAIRPAAMAYRHLVPKPLRDGAHNALSNFGEPLVFLNDFLQLRPKRMLRTLARFLINSTLGVGGLFDIAKRSYVNIPHHANSFGDTLGFYGVKPGPYIYLPILGPTTVRDTIGGVDSRLPGALVGGLLNRSEFTTSTTIVGGLDQRERNDDDLKSMLSDAVDPYATFRANYLQDRAGEIEALKAHDAKAAPLEADGSSTDPAVTPPVSSEEKSTP
jgi:phospholipid-binding lipoprotein MlaA